MRQTFIQLSKRMLSLFPVRHRPAKPHSDQQKLLQHIVAINDLKTSGQIMAETATCLKEMTHYQLCGFAVKKEDNVDAWLDSRIVNGSFEKILCEDFNIRDKEKLASHHHHFHPEPPIFQPEMKDLISYDVKDEKFYSRIYALPRKKNNSSQKQAVSHDAMSMILHSCSTAMIRQATIKDLSDAAVIDSLTGCYNRREFENQLKRHVASATRYKNDLSVFMFDLDRFKSINDTYGHPAGDKVLQKVASLVLKNMRSGDVLARYGGEEFIAILPETDKYKAMELADRLRIKISRQQITWDGQPIQVTASFGVAELNPRADMDRIIQDADTMLYKAKISGRNTVMPGLIKVVPSKIKQFR